ncbi:MAG: DUF3298 domain-containing protein [Selenomonas sp.]|nr:DUF3298 domain-containing protein [Selenomonas sp.]
MLRKVKLRGVLCAGVIAALLAGSCAEAAPRAICGFYKQIRQQTYMDRDARGEYEILEERWGGLAVDKELTARFPALSKAIEQRTKADWAHMEKQRRQMKVEAVQFREESPAYYHPFAQDLDVLMRRADEHVTSYLEMEYTNGGGAHGMYGWQGVNFNSMTGEELALSHVVKDLGRFTDIIIAQLQKEYPQASFFDMEKTVRNRAMMGRLNWTIDPRGVTVYFNPYGIASYADGLLQTTVLFKEQPQLFNEAYLETADAYAQPFPTYYPLVTSLRDNDKRDVLSVDQGEGKVTVSLNGRKYDFDAQLTKLQPVLVHMANKDNFLYIDGQTPEGSRLTLVLKVAKGKVQHVGTLPYTFMHTIAVSPAEQRYWQFMTNPDGFYIDRVVPLGNSSKTDTCAVGSDGQLTFG